MIQRWARFCRQLLICAFFFISGCWQHAKATHIVGGEFEMAYLGEYKYRITLNLYFDAIYGAPGAEDPAVMIDIFGKTSSVSLNTIQLQKRSVTFVPYTNIACTVGNLSTKKIIYDKEVYLSPNKYNDPSGYYMVWERCCRNNIISNIVDAAGTGQAFYLEFPPVTVQGQPYINSSPSLFPPLSDYACTGNLYYADFSGKDPDGDSLVYSMVTPLRGSSSQIQPIPEQNSAAPYDSVTWGAGFSVSNQVPGPEPLQIDPVSGLLRVTPDLIGLFVFAVRCQEFRNGVKIGEVRRDFQLLVLSCPQNQPPDIVAQTPDGQPYQPGQVLSITGSDSICLTFIVTDPDPQEQVTITAKPVNFMAPDFSFTTTATLSNTSGSDTLTATFCLPDCLPQQDEPYILDVLVKDDGCALPKLDTVRVLFNYVQAINDLPVLSLQQPDGQAQPLQVQIEIGEQLEFLVLGTDVNNNLLALQGEGENFDLGAAGILFPPASAAGYVESTFSWIPACDKGGPGTYEILIRLTETTCSPRDTSVVLTVTVIDKPTVQPFIPSNIFTPNGDGVNDFFEFPSLPPDNCGNSFVKLQLFNRWGKRVYQDTRRDFRWDGSNVPEGIYYYLVEYEKAHYKGYVTLIR